MGRYFWKVAETRKKKGVGRIRPIPKTLLSLVLGCALLTPTTNSKAHAHKRKYKNKVPIVYSESYNFDLMGLQKYHPFANKDYRVTFQKLQAGFQQGLTLKDVHEPQPLSDEQLLTVHSRAYLNSLSDPETDGVFPYFEKLSRPALATERELLESNRETISQTILATQRLGAGGTLKTTQLAQEGTWAINLSGGYHHAFKERGSGFCLIADIPIAVKQFLNQTSQLSRDKQSRVLIVDLDAHHGDGNAAIFNRQPRVAIFDIYNEAIFPFPEIRERREMHAIKYGYPIPSGTKDEEYLEVLRTHLPAAIQEFKPHLIIYNAGTDIYEKDPHGRLKISREGIIARDQFVFQEAVDNQIPIAMLLSGGYHSDVFPIIGDSIINLVNKKIISLQ